MSEPDLYSKHPRRFSSRHLLPLGPVLALLMVACGGTVVSKTEGGPGGKQPVKLVWETETSSISGRNHHVYCLNARDGSVIWDFETGFEVGIYIGAFNGKLHCLRTKPSGWETTEGIGG
jgi:outer membrane protein assembly factor BamB